MPQKWQPIPNYCTPTTSNTMAWEIRVHNLLVLHVCSCTFMRIQNSNLVTKIGSGSQPCVTFKLNMAISCFQDHLFHVGVSNNYLAASNNNSHQTECHSNMYMYPCNYFPNHQINLEQLVKFTCTVICALNTFGIFC